MKLLKKSLVFCLVFLVFAVKITTAQNKTFPVKFEELTAPEFIEAVDKSGKICIIPMGILEKHGAHLPLGTDLIDARDIALRAARTEYAVVFPPYYFGQIFEAMHQPGTISYSAELIWKLLEETCDELARNGFKYIVLVNGHGGNNSFLSYFCQTRLAQRKDYAVIFFSKTEDPEISKKIESLRKTKGGGHADEIETSMIYSHRPDLVHPERAGEQSGKDLDRLASIKNAYTGIWWYAKFPNHYAGDGSHASKEIGELTINSSVNQLVNLIKTLKSNHAILELQDEFYNKAENPLKTTQKQKNE